MRRLWILGLLALAACDTAGRDPVAYDGIVEVSLAQTREGDPALLLVAVDDGGCNSPLAVETDATPERLDVRVVGIGPLPDVQCEALIPARALVPLPFVEQGGFPVTVAHRGATDAYAYSVGFAGQRLDAVRTSTTRLASPPP